jgi:cell division protein FtsB
MVTLDEVINEMQKRQDAFGGFIFDLWQENKELKARLNALETDIKDLKRGNK